MIRSYRDNDAGFLAPIHTAFFPADPLSGNNFGETMTYAFQYGGKAWIIEEESPLGYALIVPVPGLPHIVELSGGIDPPYQRRGLGSRLLGHVLNELRLQAGVVRQVSHQVRSLNSPAALFLIKNGFYIEHEEIVLRRCDLQNIPRPSGGEGVEIVLMSRSKCVKTFSSLFSASFAGLPWDQPFSEDEIEDMLDDAADILFLTKESRPIGFAWLHLKDHRLGLIEPLGILPGYRQQGYGRFFVKNAVFVLLRRGATHAQIGAWRTNHPAISIYQSLGFEHHETITYLAQDI
jgi:ribosomal protein S18 acetylase RimI-like enzyme